MVGEFQPALPTGPSDPFLKMFPTGEKTIRPQFRNKGDREGEHSGSSLGLHYRGVTGDELTFPGRRERFWTVASAFGSTDPSSLQVSKPTVSVWGSYPTEIKIKYMKNIYILSR